MAGAVSSPRGNPRQLQGVVVMVVQAEGEAPNSHGRYEALGDLVNVGVHWEDRQEALI